MAHDEAAALVRRLAGQTRGAGSAGEQEARDYCVRWLEGEGFDVRLREFEFSQFAGRYAAPAIGLVLILFFAGNGLLLIEGARSSRVLLTIGAAILIAALAASAGRWGVTRLPLLRASGTNVEAVQESTANVWLVAHLDSKSQPVAILLRAASVTLSIALALPLLFRLTEMGEAILTPAAAAVLGAAGMVCTLPLALSFVLDESAGALDNGSGVAAVLLAARELRRTGVRGVGVLLTGAEELALAGAHCWVSGRARGTALNCDTVDDVGDFVIVGAASSAVASASVRAATTAGVRIRVLPTLPGILMDSQAFSAGGWEAATLARGTLGTLGRIHTRADTADRVAGSGVVTAARILTGAAHELANRAGR